MFAAAAGNAGRKRKKKSGDIDPADVERAVIALFGLVAMVRGPHWAVTDRGEVAAWSDDAAALVGKIPTRVAAAALNASAALSVAVGLGTMVYRRAQVDAEIQRQVAARLADERRKAAAARPTGVPTAASNAAAAASTSQAAPNGTVQGSPRDLFPELYGGGY